VAAHRVTAGEGWGRGEGGYTQEEGERKGEPEQAGTTRHTHTNTQYVCHPQALPADGRWPRHPAARRAVHLVQAAAAAVGAATGAAQPTSDGAAVARKEAPSGAHACRGVEPVRAGKVGVELPAPEGRSREGAGDDTRC